MLPLCIEKITHFVNISLTKGLFANDWKTAIVHPLLKKFGLELIKENYRPVSYICLLPKFIKYCMLKQLISHCNTNSLIPNFKSPCRDTYIRDNSLLKYPMTYPSQWKSNKSQWWSSLTSQLPLIWWNTISCAILYQINMESQIKTYNGSTTIYGHSTWRYISEIITQDPNNYTLVCPKGSCSGAIFLCVTVL